MYAKTQSSTQARRRATSLLSTLLLGTLAGGAAWALPPVLGGTVRIGQDPAQGDKPQPAPAPNPSPIPEKKEGETPIGRQGQAVDPNAKLTIEFGAEKFDMGTVRQGEKREHLFEMSSGGTAPLIIYQAKPSCGCTVGETRVANDQGEFVPYKMGDPISPGRKIQIAATLDTTNKHGATQVRISVSANDPVGLIQLALAANVESLLNVSPSALMFGDLSEDSVKEGLVTVRSPAGEPVKLTIDESQPFPKPKGLEVALTAVDPDAEGRAELWHLKVNVGPGLTEGQVGYRVNLMTDREMPGAKELPNGQKQMYQANVSISGRVLGVLTCAPQYFSLGLVRPGQVVSRTVKLTSNDPNFALDKVTATITGFNGEEFPWKDAFSTMIRPVPGENSLEIELRLDGLPEGADGTFKGQVVIETGHPDKPQIPVSFSGVARAGVTTGNTPPKGTKIVPPPGGEEKKDGTGGH
jgi:hypothetical protein